MFYEINGDIEKFNNELTTGGSVMEGYNKVTESWANKIDKMSENLKNLKLAFMAVSLDGVKPMIDTINDLLKGMSSVKDSSVGTQVALSTLSTSFVTLALISTANLGFVQSAFTGIKTAIVSTIASMKTLNLAYFTTLQTGKMSATGLAVSLGAVFVVFAGIMAYIEAQNRKTDAMMSKFEEDKAKIEEVKKRIDSAKNAIRDLANDTASINFNNKWKDINDTLRESLDTFKDMADTIKTASDLKVKMSMKIDEKAFEEQRKKIANTGVWFSEFTENSPKVKELASERTFMAGISDEDVKNKEKEILNKVRDSEKKINEGIRGILLEEANKKYHSTDYEKYKTLDATGKAKFIPSTGISKQQMLKEASEVDKFNEEIKKKQSAFWNKRQEGFNGLASYLGWTEAEKTEIFKSIDSVFTENKAKIIENEKALQESRYNRLRDLENYLNIFETDITNLQLKFTNIFLQKTSFKGVEDFNKALKSKDLGEYSEMLKEFKGTIDSFASEKSKLAFLKGDFLNVVSTNKQLQNQINDTRDIINSAKSDKMASTGKTFGEYLKAGGKLSDVTDINDRKQLEAIKKYEEAIPKIKKQMNANIENAKIQQKSYVTLENYNNGLDIQLLSLERLNASKMKGYDIDLKASELKFKELDADLKLKKKVQNEGIRDDFKDSINKTGVVDLTKKNSFAELRELSGIKSFNINDFSQVENFIKSLGGKESFIDADATNFYQQVLDIYKTMSDMRKNEVDYKSASMTYDKNSLQYQEEVFNSYIDYFGKSQTEIATLQQKKILLQQQANITENSTEKLDLMIQMYKIEADIKSKEFEQNQKLADIALKRVKYESELASYSADDLKYLKNKYDIEQEILAGEKKAIEDKMIDYRNKTFSQEGVEGINTMLSDSLKKYTDKQDELLKKSTLTKEEETEKVDIAKKLLEIQGKIAVIKSLDLSTEEGQKKFLEMSVEYKGMELDLLEKEGKIKESNSTYDKESLRIQAELNDLIGQRKLVMSEQDYQKSRDLYKEVFGSGNTYLDEQNKRNSEKEKAKTEIENAQKELDRVRESIISKMKPEDIPFLSNILKNNVEYQKAGQVVLEKSTAQLTLINEQEKQRLEYIKGQAETLLGMIDSLSKGETIKFDASSAIKGSAGAFTKLSQSFTAEGRYKAGAGKAENEKMTMKDWADIAQAGLGVATNIYGQVVQSQLNVVDAELKNLDIRKQLARTDEERQKIDEEILNKQKQQIDLQYKQQTQFAGISGTTGSALGGAMSGAMLGGQVGGAYGAIAGGLLGGISGIFGGNSAKKQAERQKKQLEAQLRANQYLESLNKLQELNNNLIKTVFDSTSKGIQQALKDAFKELSKTMEESGTFKVNEEWIKSIAKDPTKTSSQADIVKKLGLDTELITEVIGYSTGSVGPQAITTTYFENFTQDFTDYLNNSISSIQEGIGELTFTSSLSDISAVNSEIETLKTNIKSIQGNLGDQTSDEMLLKQLEDWQTYLTTLENIAKKTNVFYSEYFGFAVDYTETEGIITDVAIGEWEKRTEILDSMVQNSIDGIDNISKSIATITIEGFANSFIRNNKALSTSLSILEEDMKEFSNLQAGVLSTDLGELKVELESISSTIESYGSTVQNELEKIAVINIVNDSKALNIQQEEMNKQVTEFVNLWIQAGGSIEDVIDLMPEYSKTLQNAMKSSLSITDYQERFNSIGSALTSTIESKLAEVSFANLQNKFLASNEILSTIMSGGEVDMNSMIQLSQSLKSYSAQAEQTAYKTKAMLEMLSMESNVDYGIDNTQIEYQTGTTSTNVYNFNNSINTTIGNFLADNKAVQQFTDTIVGNMFESFKKQGFKIEK